MSGKKRILQSFTLNEISSVDRPAQAPARMTIAKREVIKMAGEDPKNTGAPSPEVEELKRQVAELIAEKDSYKMMSEMSDEEKAYAEGMEEEAKKAFIAKSHDERKSIIEKAAKDDEFVVISGQSIKKSEAGPMFEVLKAQAEKLEAQEAELKKSASAARVKDFVGIAKSEYSGIPGTPEEIGSALDAIEAIGGDVYKTVTRVFKAHAEVSEKASSVAGHANGKVDKSADEELEKKVQEYAKANNVSVAKAYTAVLDENPELYTVGA